MQYNLEPLSDFDISENIGGFVMEDTELFETLQNEVKHEEQAQELFLLAEEYLSITGDDVTCLDASLFSSMEPHEQHKLLCMLDK